MGTDEIRLPVILIVEDDEDDRLLVAKALAQAQIPTDTRFVEDGEELIDYLHRRGTWLDLANSPRPSLILLDLRMPRKDGLTALLEVKSDERFKRIPVIVLTTSANEDEVERAWDAGVSGFITKPASRGGLHRVANAIRDYWFGVITFPKISD